MQLLAYLPMVGRHPTKAPNDGGYQVNELCKGGKEQVGGFGGFWCFVVVVFCVCVGGFGWFAVYCFAIFLLGVLCIVHFS